MNFNVLPTELLGDTAQASERIQIKEGFKTLVYNDGS